MPTAADIVNQALEYIAAQTQITALNDGSTAAIAATTVYAPVVQLLLRGLDPDFARRTAALVTSSAVPVPPWTYGYAYPDDCVRLRQVRPPGGYDQNDPQPVRAEVAFDAVAGKIILSNQAGALAVYTSLQVTETQWDAAFTDTVVRRLANPLAMALSGRPDFAKELLDEAFRSAAMAESVDDSAVRR